MSELRTLGIFPAASAWAWLAWESSRSRGLAETKVSSHWWKNKYLFPELSLKKHKHKLSPSLVRDVSNLISDSSPRLEKTFRKTRGTFLEHRWSKVCHMLCVQHSGH